MTYLTSVSALKSLEMFEKLHENHQKLIEEKVLDLYANLTNLRLYLSTDKCKIFDKTPLNELPIFITKTLKVSKPFVETLTMDIRSLSTDNNRNCNDLSYSVLNDRFESLDLEAKTKLMTKDMCVTPPNQRSSTPKFTQYGIEFHKF